MNFQKIILFLAISSLTLGSTIPEFKLKQSKLNTLFKNGLAASRSLKESKRYYGGIDELQAKVCPDSLFLDILKSYSNKYPYEVHNVNTEDGYILRVFRIQAKNTNIVDGKRVIFLQHGLIDSSDDWIINGEEYSLGLFLANQGYDVWMGNSRGNKYSMDTTKKMTDKEYWDFSFQQMAQFDVPANIKYVLSKTGQKTLIYAGHSQGTSQMFAALADTKTSEYVNSKVDKFIALAPIVYLANQESTLLNVLAYGSIGLETLANTFGVRTIFPGACSATSIQSQFMSAVCKVAKPFCNGILSIADADPRYDNTSQLPYYLKHSPSGSSLMQFFHYKQWVKQSGKNPQFTMYDYGYFKNKQVYGQSKPPVWDLSKIKTKVAAFVGNHDKLGDVKDNTILQARLNVMGVENNFRFYENCGHMTFMWSKPATATQMFKDILQEIETA